MYLDLGVISYHLDLIAKLAFLSMTFDIAMQQLLLFLTGCHRMPARLPL